MSRDAIVEAEPTTNALPRIKRGRTSPRGLTAPRSSFNLSHLPLNYQKIVCWGDSQTFGARTYGCYPLYMVRILNRETRYTWNALSICKNGYTARDLWFRLGLDLLTMTDTKQACILRWGQRRG